MADDDLTEFNVGWLAMGARDALRSKDRTAARKLAGLLAEALQPGSPPLPEAHRQFLYEALSAIATGADPAEVFLFKAPRGRPPKDEFTLEVAQAVHDFAGGKHKAPGGAYYVIGEQFKLSPEAAESAYRKWRDGLEVHDEANREMMREEQEALEQYQRELWDD